MMLELQSTLLGIIHLRNCKIVFGGVRKLAYDFLKKNL